LNSEADTTFTLPELRLIPHDWKVSRLRDVAGINELTLRNDFPFRTIEYIDIDSVEEGIIKNSKEMEVNKAPTRARRLLRSGDIIISTVRPNLKHYARIKVIKRNSVCSTGFLVVTPKTIDSAFLYYFLTLQSYTDFLSAIAAGQTSAYPSFNPNVVENTNVPFPPISEQQAIAKILSDLDEKIELNNQMNKTLEDIVQAIFKRWFIDFEFPNENGEPYKSSGGEMVESELGMIPKGWEVKFLEDLFIFKRGEEVGSKNYSDSQNPDFIQFYRVHDISSYGNQSKTYIDKKLIKTGFFKNDDILVSLDGTIGRVYFGGNGAYSSGIRKIESKYSFLGKGAILSLLKSKLFQNELILYSADATTIKHASEAIKNIKIVYNKNILEDYSRVTEPIFYMMLNNVNNNLTLINIRDLLLPKLMTGKIRVPMEEQNVQ